MVEPLTAATTAMLKPLLFMTRTARLVGVLATCSLATLSAAPSDAPSPADPLFRQYCTGCHGKAAMGGINLEKLLANPSMGEQFQQWERIITALEEKQMPPAKMKQPADEDRQRAIAAVRNSLHAYAEKHAGDPGRVTVRRLTGGEYTYAIQDLTGLDLRFDSDFASDAVGGEGFTNFGDVQFMEDANLERYLQAAKRISDHAVIGAGPLQFFEHSGKSGFELSAIHRIQNIYRKHGFRAVAGEGARPYGLDMYGKAFLVAWRYKHRAALGYPAATLATLAAKEQISPTFARHIWTVLQDPKPSYPVSEVIGKWRDLPAPTPRTKDAVSLEARTKATELQQFTVDWVRWLFAAGPLESAVGDDRVYLLTEPTLRVNKRQMVRFLLRNTGSKTAKLYLSAAQMNPQSRATPPVTWKNAKLRLRRATDSTNVNAPRPPQVLFKDFLGEDGVRNLVAGTAADPQSLSVATGSILELNVPMPADAVTLELQFEIEAGEGLQDSVVRAAVSDKREFGKGRTMSALLGDSANAGYKAWKAGVLDFAARLPQLSHGEPTPSDRDPIAEPFNNTYNQPERDHYHNKLKYYRDDRFLVEKIIDTDTRSKLDAAWADLLTSFDYHDEFFRFLIKKYSLSTTAKTVAELTPEQISAFPAESRKYVQALRDERASLWAKRDAARAGHVSDALRFAEQAWRRPLTRAEQTRLREFYAKTLETTSQDHPKAVRALLTRVLIAPAFLYRLEQSAVPVSGDRPLTSWEMANRLSFFLWSSAPDAELRRAAAAGELTQTRHLERQVKRMLADAKARRLGTEFFGQWLGFYRFDQYRGVDSTRYPEFTDEVKSGMYDEAVSFFTHIVRQDRPVREMISANYTFLTPSLAKHYGVTEQVPASDEPVKVDGADRYGRGGLLRLGAVLTATSAPLRTSPVKRGDWVLRRVLGTPTPPPPADAGSIPADDKLFGGMTVFERLQAHQRNPTCASCHTRIDPLGFPLERYDAVGRLRDKYADGKPIHDTVALGDKQINGVEGLLGYLQTKEKQVLKTFSQKLIGYALGRTVLASDQPLIDKLVAAGGNAKFSDIATEIVASRQFRYRKEEIGAEPGLPAPKQTSPATSAPARPTKPATASARSKSNNSSTEGGL